MLVALLFLAGMGAASFHPTAAATVGRAGGHRKGLAMSAFVTAGIGGFASGPLVILPVVSTFGLKATPLTTLWGAVVALILLLGLRFDNPVSVPKTGLPSFRELRPALRAIALLYGIVVIRAFIVLGFSNFVPLYLTSRGFPLFLAGVGVTAFQASGATGCFLGGLLADRLGNRSVLLLSFWGAFPLLLAFLNIRQEWTIGVLGLAGLFLLSSIPINIVLAQGISPERAGLMSSIAMGFGWGTGGILLTLLGAVADHFGLHAALQGLALLTLLGIFLIHLLPGYVWQKRRGLERG